MNVPFVKHDQNLPTCQTPSQSVTMSCKCPEWFCVLGREGII